MSEVDLLDLFKGMQVQMQARLNITVRRSRLSGVA